ncbi:MAG: methyltransferase domain-containing protein [Proteobacteria bacterium]|nr:methyltransferase domain-containing protein [Pseudomonadota bacterium]MBU0964743.1 methyltransferase domain-containing protein [Pseudomonadota bacterium]
MHFKDIDWNSLWQEARQQKSWKKKGNRDWDKRAPGFAKRNIDSNYADRFLELVQPEPHWRVLDIGCGPGTLALPLAARVNAVTAIDFSSAMLAELEKRAAEQGITNITTIQASWTDDWGKLGIPEHEVVISSRSLSVVDLQSALEKMNNWATEKIFIADRVGSGPFDPDLFAAVGRPFEPGPDYIFTVNLLYQMGIHPKIDYIEIDQTKTFATKDDAMESCRWMFDDLSPDEEARLAAYVDERLEHNEAGTYYLRRSSRVKWALLSWEKRTV